MRKFFCPIVITDVQMPGMGSLSLCRKLRAGKWPGYVYIIVMTGHDQEDGIGGEEFAAILPHTSRDDAVVVAERLRAAIESTPFATAAGELSITVSIGIGSLSNRVSMEPQTTLDVLDEADRGLYESKRRGRNQVTAVPATEPRTLLEVSS